MNRIKNTSGEGTAPQRERVESFLVALGLFLAALVWFWISLGEG